MDYAEKRKAAWTAEEIRLMLKIMYDKNVVRRVDRKKSMSKKLYTEVEREMRQKGSNKGYCQIRSKFKSLRHEYKKQMEGDLERSYITNQHKTILHQILNDQRPLGDADIIKPDTGLNTDHESVYILKGVPDDGSSDDDATTTTTDIPSPEKETSHPPEPSHTIDVLEIAETGNMAPEDNCSTSTVSADEPVRIPIRSSKKKKRKALDSLDAIMREQREWEEKFAEKQMRRNEQLLDKTISSLCSGFFAGMKSLLRESFPADTGPNNGRGSAGGSS